jgi:lysozyme family protein
LQAALGVEMDGTIGPLTLAAAAKREPRTLISDLCARRLAFLRSLSTYSVFGRGWERRVSEIEAAALAG